MSFSRPTSSILYPYNIDSIELSRVNCMKDLGVILNPKLAFNFHVDYVISKSLSMLGFIQRNSSEFTDASSILCLYSSLVRPHLEYCSVIWNPIFLFFRQSAKFLCTKTWERIKIIACGFFVWKVHTGNRNSQIFEPIARRLTKLKPNEVFNDFLYLRIRSIKSIRVFLF